jgi:hypothetical protein
MFTHYANRFNNFGDVLQLADNLKMTPNTTIIGATYGSDSQLPIQMTQLVSNIAGAPLITHISFSNSTGYMPLAALIAQQIC